MKKAILMTLGLAFSTAFFGSAHATNAEEQNAIGRASDRIGNPIRKAQKEHPSLRGKKYHPIHRLKHAHPIRRLEGR